MANHKNGDKEKFQDFVEVDKINPDAILPTAEPDEATPENDDVNSDTKPIISYSVSPQLPQKPPRLAPLNNKQKRAIESGQYNIEAKLDLHGETRKDAHQKVISFINHSKINQHRMLLIVTGKGKGILRGDLPSWLQQFQHDILHHCFAAPKHGGDGAYYVYLRKSKS
ncbi:MAG: Smr/MutS family protein [Alphaproteobacteria bacterium]|nr:Smr/MutS family protein [Alphaproteobacteria bacterium]